MDKQRVRAYNDLIHQVLTCPEGQEPEILQQNSQLIDEGFFQAANYYAHRLQEDGKEQLAAFLLDLVEKLAEVTDSVTQTRQQAYLNLISLLLQYPSEINQILNANQDLVDAGMIVTMREVAQRLNMEGDNNGTILENIASQLSQQIGHEQVSQAHIDFLLEIMHRVSNSNEEERIYPVLRQNLHLIDDNLNYALRSWVSNISDDSRERTDVSDIIFDFSCLIQEFPLGSKAENVEGEENFTTVLTAGENYNVNLERDRVVTNLIDADTTPNLPSPVFGTIEADIIEVDSNGQLVFAGDSDDLIDASIASGGGNRIYGGNGNDTIVLGEDDRVFGGEGSDCIFATSGGNNTITGGVSADQFWIAVASIPESANIITDFTLGEDVIGIAGLDVSFEDLTITQSNADTIIAVNGSDLAVLEDVNVDSLNRNSFAFGFRLI